MEDQKKVTAAMAAVMTYIQQEEEMIAASGMPGAAPAPAAPVNNWGLSGRQSQMQLRGLMQLKALHGAKLR